MNDKAGRIDAVGRFAQNISGKVNLHEAAGRDLLKEQANWVDQEMFVRPWHARGQMGKNKVIPTMMGYQTIGASEIDAGAPFLSRY
jgi:hypothetical protein